MDDLCGQPGDASGGQADACDRRLRALMSIVHTMVWRMDASFRQRDPQPSWEAYTGQAWPASADRGWLAMVHPEDQGVLAIDGASPPGGAFEARLRLWHKASGGYRWVETRGVAVRDEAGAVVEWLGTTQDVHDRVLAIEGLRVREEVFRLAADAVNGLIYEWDVTTGRAVRSRGLVELLGIDPSEAPETAEWWVSRIHPEDRPAKVERMRRLLSDPLCESAVNEYRVLHRDGRWIEVRDSKRLVRDAQGKLVRVVGCTVDVSRERRLERELRSANQDLETAVRVRTAELHRTNERLRLSERLAALGTLSVGIGHDMGNLLLPVRVRVESLEHGLSALQGAPAGAVEELRADVAAIRASAEYLQRLATGLRQLAHDPDREGPARHSVTLGNWWEDVEPMMRAALPPGVVLQVTHEQDAPSPRIAAHRLTQIVFNLVQNAGDAVRDEAHPRVWLRIARAEDGASFEVSVRDNGVGMDEATRRRCTEPFFTTKTRGLSTGLGLTLVTKLAHAAGGSLSVESQAGAGSVFRVVLPAERGEDAAGLRAAVAVADPRMRALAKAILRGLGVRACDAADCDEQDQERASPETAHGARQRERTAPRLSGMLPLITDDAERARAWARAAQGTPVLIDLSRFAEGAGQRAPRVSEGVLVSKADAASLRDTLAAALRSRAEDGSRGRGASPPQSSGQSEEAS